MGMLYYRPQSEVLQMQAESKYKFGHNELVI